MLFYYLEVMPSVGQYDLQEMKSAIGHNWNGVKKTRSTSSMYVER
jgi:hypothetical protein